jgi:hypothetical protein
MFASVVIYLFKITTIILGLYLNILNYSFNRQIGKHSTEFAKLDWKQNHDQQENTGRSALWFSYDISQCCATFLHSRHTKYCRRVMAAHQPHFSYCGGGGRWFMALIGRDNFLWIDPNRKIFYLMFVIIHLYYYAIYFKYIHYLK